MPSPPQPPVLSSRQKGDVSNSKLSSPYSKMAYKRPRNAANKVNKLPSPFQTHTQKADTQKTRYKNLW